MNCTEFLTLTNWGVMNCEFLWGEVYWEFRLYPVRRGIYIPARVGNFGNFPQLKMLKFVYIYIKILARHLQHSVILTKSIIWTKCNAATIEFLTLFGWHRSPFEVVIRGVVQNSRHLQLALEGLKFLISSVCEVWISDWVNFCTKQVWFRL